MPHRAGVAAVLIVAVAPVETFDRANRRLLVQIQFGIFGALLHELLAQFALLEETVDGGLAENFNADELGEILRGRRLRIFQQERLQLAHGVAHVLIVRDEAQILDVDRQ